MVQVTVVVREIDGLKPDYSLKFSLPEIPRPGDYISIRRPDAKLHTEDLVVRRVWWELHHGETRPSAPPDDEIIGSLQEIMVECDQAIGPYSRDHWLRTLEAAEERGVQVERFEVARFSVRESDLSE